MKIIFFGSDDFAVTHLDELMQSGHEILACVTQPDRAKGRGLKVSALAVKESAQKHKLPVLQPKTVSDAQFIQQLKDYNCDLFVVVAYGKILPPEVLEIPYVCAINIHGSLLPKYRGAAPINWAIINGDKQTGVSIIKMNPQMDAGDVFVKETIVIQDDDTSVTLRAKMAKLGAVTLCRTIKSIEKNEYSLEVQDKSQVTMAPKLTKELGIIDWNQPAQVIHNQVRGLLPWPSAYTSFKGKMLKVLETELTSVSAGDAAPGQVIEITKPGIIVQTAKGALLVKKVHLESAKPMDAKSFAAGQKVSLETTFGK